MYESFYNLAEPPFRLTPDPRFYFSSATHKRALTHLRFGFHQREGFVVITGKPGTGKTELMLHLLDGLPQERITYGKIVTSNLDPNEILQQVAAAFHIQAQGLKKGVLLKRLEDVFLQHVRENRRMVLIVDEAHKLTLNSLNELQMLTNFQLSGRAALQCFLSGHDSLKVNLQNPELLHLKQRVITSTFLMPLDRSETPQYVEHRLRCVGWEGDPKFNQSAYSVIHETTEGIPRQINALCNRVLLRAYAEQKHYIDESMVLRAIDDVQAEPLASNLTYNTAVAHSVGSEVYSAPGESSRRAYDYSTETQDIAHYTSPAKTHKTHAFFENDQDETLPLPSGHDAYSDASGGIGVNSTSAANQVITNDHANGKGSQESRAVYGYGVPRPGAGRVIDSPDDTLPINGDDDIESEAHKFSNALSEFHHHTSSAKSKLPARSRSPFQIDETTHASRSGRTLRYGLVSMVLFMLVGSAVYWVYPRLQNINPMQAEMPVQGFVAAIEGVISGDSSPSDLAEHNKSAVDHETTSQNVDEQLTTNQSKQNTPSITNEESERQVVASATEAEQTSGETATTQAKDDGETWSSGALGGQFLAQQKEQPAAEPANDGEGAAGSSVAQLTGTKGGENTTTAKAQDQESTKLKSPAASKPTAVKTETGKTSTTVAIAPAVQLPASTKHTVASKSKPAVKSPPSEKIKSQQPTIKSTANAGAGVGNKVYKNKPNKELGNKAADKVAALPKSNAVVLDPKPAESAVIGSEAKDSIDTVQLDDLLIKLTSAYEKGNLNQLLSVLSKDVRSNDGATRRQIKDGYRKLFNITDMRKMTITGVNWSRQNQMIRGEGEFKLFVREKGADKITSYGGIINLEVNQGAGGVEISKLTYDYNH